ncbi:MAG: hypothetical protein LC734_08825 [Acidobacteria bacterium]|nr:hypothetical protein [Acidobacteriota bacterium]
MSAMSFTVYLSGHLKSFTGGETEVVLDENFTAVGDVLDSLWTRHPSLPEPPA